MSERPTADIVAELRAMNAMNWDGTTLHEAADRLAELEAEHGDIARHLRYLANELRNADRDVGLVIIDDDGVSPSPLSFADALELVAIQLAGVLP